MKNPLFKDLPFKDRNKIIFNWVAFFFGPLYYFAKKMWFKGAFILGAVWIFNAIFSIIEAAVGLTFPAVIFWVVPAVICSQLANYDYYKHVNDGETIWKGFPGILKKPSGAIGFPVVSFVVLILALGISAPGVPECGSTEATNLVVNISKGELQKQVGKQIANTIDLAVSAIRTTSVNEQTGAFECAAQLDMTGNKGTNSIPITYTVEMTDNGEEVYVNVFGLVK